MNGAELFITVEGVDGDYDDFENVEDLFLFIKTGKR